MNIMNLISTSPQMQAEMTSDSMTTNWQNVFQDVIKQDVANTSSVIAFNPRNQNESNEQLNVSTILETLEMTEEELIELLELMKTALENHGSIELSELVALFNEHIMSKEKNDHDTTFEPSNDLKDELTTDSDHWLKNESNEQDLTHPEDEVSIEIQEEIKELLKELLNHDEADYNELLAKLRVSNQIEASMIEKIRQFIFALKEMNLDKAEIQSENLLVELAAKLLPSNEFKVLINPYEVNQDIRLEETETDEQMIENVTYLAEEQIEATEHEMIQLVTEINKLLDGFMGKSTDLPRNILQILDRWTQLQKEAPTLLAEIKERFTSEKHSKIWQQLIQTYEKRQSFSKQSIYQSASSITRQDVHRWLEQAVSQYEQATNQSQSIPTVAQTMMPINEVQQYDIHLQATNRIEKISNELVNQLTNVIQKSNFMQGRQLNQLTITLNPENLGNITVRLVEVDGEMTVKLLVTSNLTKRALETNIHQLKHMFSPHQIAIEREEGISDEEFFAEDEPLEEESLEEGKESEENEEETPEIDFEELLQEIREEEEVDDKD